MRLVYYSLANSPGSICEAQWVQSVRSLRRYNSSVAISLLLYNGAQQTLLDEASRLNVQVEYLGSYVETLYRLHPRGAELALYPTLHKFLVAPRLSLSGVSQLLYLDCDTFFSDNVERLFDGYTQAAWNAREEPLSRRSHYGPDRSHIDEEALEATARREGLSVVTPFNTGVCLFNHGIWQHFSAIAQNFLDIAWRLMIGREVNVDDAAVQDPAMHAAVVGSLSAEDRARALPYPSTNSWILDQVALWLSLRELPGFSLELLRREDVQQGGEFAEAFTPQPILTHYYSTMQEQFFSQVAPLAE